MIKKSFLIENNIYFEVGRKISEDIFFIINCLINGKASFVNENLFNYIFRQNSVVNSPSSKYLLKSNIDGWFFVKNHIESLDECFFNKEYVINYIKEYIFKLEIGYLSELMKNFNFSTMRVYINNSLFYDHSNTVNISNLSKSERKKFNFIIKNNFWWLGAIYYRYLRINFRKK